MTRPPRGMGRALATAIIAVSASFVRPSIAHTPLTSRSEFEWRDLSEVEATLVFAWQDAVLLGKALDTPEADQPSHGGDGPLFPGVVRRGIVVTLDGQPCAGKLDASGPFQGDGFVFAASFHCVAESGELRVELPLLAALPPEHRHMVRLSAGANATEATLSGEQTSVSLLIPRKGPPPSSSASAPSVTASPRQTVSLEARRWLTGWSRLLFLVGAALAIFWIVRRAR